MAIASPIGPSLGDELPIRVTDIDVKEIIAFISFIHESCTRRHVDKGKTTTS